MKKHNYLLPLLWFISLILFIPLGVMAGAIDGLMNAVKQSYKDVFNKELY